MNPIQIPQDWDDRGLITFEEFCDLIRTPQRTVRDWRQRGLGPRWARFNGCGRLYITVAEARRFADGTITAYQCCRRPIRIRLDELEAALHRIPSARW